MCLVEKKISMLLFHNSFSYKKPQIKYTCCVAAMQLIGLYRAHQTREYFKARDIH